MFTETLIDHDGVIGVACQGTLIEDDVKGMHALLHRRFAEAQKPSVVIDWIRFKGYERFSTLREDLKMDMAHGNDFTHQCSKLCRDALIRKSQSGRHRQMGAPGLTWPTLSAFRRCQTGWLRRMRIACSAPYFPCFSAADTLFDTLGNSALRR